jgi:hypothetical protein
MNQRYIRFQDETLQASFLGELSRADIKYTLDPKGAVRFQDSEAMSVIDAAHRVRDAQFSWYFIHCYTDEESALFRTLLIRDGLPFFVEEHESGIWFLVRRSDKIEHEHLFELMVKP